MFDFIDKGLKKTGEFAEKNLQAIEQQKQQEKMNQELKKQQEDEKRERELQEHHLHISTMEKLNEYLDVERLHHSKEREKVQTVVLNTVGMQFDDLEFPYNAIVVGSADNGEVLTVEYRGVIYTHTLSKGINHLNLLNGSYIKTTKDVVVALVLTNDKRF